VVFAVEQGTVTIEDAFVLQLDGTSFSGGRAQAQVMGDRVQTVSVVGGVQLEGPSVKLAADRLALDRESGSLRLEGGVVVQSGGVLLSGAAAVYDLATGTVALSNDDAQRVTGVLSFQ
jgi:lipopolysaccharide assembly outer membrane protein LptD (OstA)